MRPIEQHAMVQQNLNISPAMPNESTVIYENDEYPTGITTVALEAHNPVSIQTYLHDVRRFQTTTVIDVFEFSEQNAGTGTGSRHNMNLNDEQSEQFIRDLVERYIPVRVIFLHLTSTLPNMQVRRVSSSQHFARSLFTKLRINPSFVPLFFGEPEYGCPGYFRHFNSDASLNSVEFFCQHPRFRLHVQPIPLSVYMLSSSEKGCTTYLVTYDSTYKISQRIHDRIQGMLDLCRAGKLPPKLLQNPYFFHSLIAHEVFEDGKKASLFVKEHLYNQLDRVDTFSRGSTVTGPEELGDITKELHFVSQNADGLIASFDTAVISLQKMRAAHQCLFDLSPPYIIKAYHVNIDDSMNRLLGSMETHIKYLQSWKSRKDTAMNLVYNLVTQQDSRTNILMSRSMKKDSSSMNTIAGLTMIYLPGTFVSGIFGMQILTFDAENQRVLLWSHWWAYLAVSIPLTCFTIGCWCYWGLVIRIIRDAVSKFRDAVGKFRSDQNT